jgi:hypothetical protein
MKLSQLTLALLTILFLMEVLVSGCIRVPDYAFPAPVDPNGPISKAVMLAAIPELPYSMTWAVNPNEQDLVIVMDKKIGAFTPFSWRFWQILGTEAAAHPFFDAANRWRFTLFAPDYTKLCELNWEAADSDTKTVRCPLAAISNYYGKGLTAQIDYTYNDPTGDPFPFLSVGRTFYVLKY